MGSPRCRKIRWITHGYGTLVTSSYPPLRSIGVVSAVSVVALAATSVLVLPALLLTEKR